MILSYILTGAGAGVFAGFLGIGGGLIMIPALVYFYGLTQHQAQGTSLAIMIPPITLLAALRYYYAGNVKIGMAVFVALGFLLGGFIGAHLAQYVPDAVLRRVFGFFLFVVALRMIFLK